MLSDDFRRDLSANITQRPYSRDFARSPALGNEGVPEKNEMERLPGPEFEKRVLFREPNLANRNLRLVAKGELSFRNREEDSSTCFKTRARELSFRN